MPGDSRFEAAVAELRSVLLGLREGMEVHDVVIPARDEVIEHFGKLLLPERLDELTEEEFRSFLLFRNNRHWTGLTRHQESMCSDMGRLRDTLALLLDESRPIEGRYTEALSSIRGFGKAVACAVLNVVYPETYGVWNNTSEAGLKQLGLWPDMERGTSRGEKYVRVNEVLHELADALELDLWTLDALWWALPGPDGRRDGTDGDGPAEEGASFGLERHLHDFLRDNWERTEFGKDWSLEVEEGEPDSGYEYPTAVGQIDLLAKHRNGRDYLVIELKRGQTSDDTLGQILRYMGWVEAKLLQSGESVQGLIIARSPDDKLRYALRRVTDVQLKLYEVSFRLQDVDLRED